MQIYLVGGAVRDMLLNTPPEDKDYVVFGSTTHEMKNLGFIQVGKDFPVFLHPVTHEEYALARREIKTGLKHTDFQFYFGKDVTEKEDVLRRDFTINALMYDEKNKKIIDLVGGQKDLEQKIIRHIDDTHFPEDPLRILRMCRFAAKLNFKIAPETLRLAQSMVLRGDIKNLAPERIWQEFEKALKTKHFSKFIIAMHECFALKEILPEIEILFPKNPLQKWDLLFQNVTNASSKVKYALLMKDLSVHDIQNIGKRLKIPKSYSDFAKCYVQNKSVLLEKEPSQKDLILLLNKVCKFQNQTLFEDFLYTAQTEFEKNTYVQKNIERLKINFEIQKNIHATDIPSFDNFKKDANLKEKILEFRAEKFV